MNPAIIPAVLAGLRERTASQAVIYEADVLAAICALSRHAVSEFPVPVPSSVGIDRIGDHASQGLSPCRCISGHPRTSA